MRIYGIKNHPVAQTFPYENTLFLEKLVLPLIIFSLISRLFIMFRYEINWDEFYYLSFVYQYVNSNLTLALQTFHVHFFTWLELLSSNEVNQIVAARAIMLLLQVATGLFIYRIGRRLLVNRYAALFSVLSYFCVSYVLKTGASFRVDPIATFCLMASLDLILLNSYKVKDVILVAFLLAISLMFTIKSALYIPTFVLISIVLIYNSAQRKKSLFRFSSMALLAALFFGLLYYFHKTSIGIETGGNDLSVVSGGFNKTLNHYIFFPRRIFLYHSLAVDFVFWCTLLYGLKTAFSAIKNGSNKIITPINAMLVITLVLPLLSVLIYRNAFPYFYSFILAPASILCGIAWKALFSINDLKKISFIASLTLFLLFFNTVTNGLVFPFAKNLDRQKALLDVIHKDFPNPVNYFDCCSMVSSFPQVGFFMSTWGVENYRQADVAVIAESIKKQQPVFFIANTALLDLDNEILRNMLVNNGLLNADKLAVKDNYIPHWGGIYVAGKQFYLQENGAEEQFMLLIDGVYTLESETEAIIDNKVIKPQETLSLLAGPHTIKAKDRQVTYKLRWGNLLYRPKNQAQDRAIFNGF